MTFASLIDRVLVPFEAHRGQMDTRAGKYLDEAQEDFSLYSKCYTKKFNMYISASKEYIDMPSDFIEMISRPVFRGAYLNERNANDLLYNKATSDNLFNKGTPQEYYIEYDKLYLVPRPSTAGILTLTYVASPTSLREKTGLYKLRFDGLVSEYFKVGMTLKGLTNNYTSVIERSIHDSTTTGTLVLSTLSNSAGYVNNESLISTSVDTTYWETIYSTFATITTAWNNLGLGGTATANGTSYVYTETEPLISNVYHYALVDYAKAMIHQDLGNGNEFQMHYAVYINSREKARVTHANSGAGGSSFVSDAIGGSF
jgi:hypothetical protein